MTRSVASRKRRLRWAWVLMRFMSALLAIGVGYVVLTTLSSTQIAFIALIVLVGLILPGFGEVLSILILWSGRVMHHCPYCGVPHLERYSITEFECASCGEPAVELASRELDQDHIIARCNQCKGGLTDE